MKISIFQRIFYFVATLLIIIVGVLVSYNWQHSKVVSLNTQVSSLKSQIVNLTNQLKNTCISTSTMSPELLNCSEYSYVSLKGHQILIFSPAKNNKVSNPVAIIGEVPGNWSFEATFPVKLIDSSGKEVVGGQAHVLGNWTTPNLVPFSAQLNYSTISSGSGLLVLYKDNPSGLSQNDDSLSIPVQF